MKKSLIAVFVILVLSFASCITDDDATKDSDGKQISKSSPGLPVSTSSSLVAASANVNLSSSEEQVSSSAMITPSVKVRMLRYKRFEMDVFQFVLINQSQVPQTNMVLKLYFRDEPGIDSTIGLRVDVAQAFDSTLYFTAIPVSEARTLSSNIRSEFASPIDTIEGVTNYCMALDLSPLALGVGGGIRIDLVLDSRDPWAPHLDLMNQKPEIELNEDDYSFKDVLELDKDWDYDKLDSIPENPNVLLMSGDNWLWGTTPE